MSSTNIQMTDINLNSDAKQALETLNVFVPEKGKTIPSHISDAAKIVASLPLDVLKGLEKRAYLRAAQVAFAVIATGLFVVHNIQKPVQQMGDTLNQNLNNGTINANINLPEENLMLDQILQAFGLDYGMVADLVSSIVAKISFNFPGVNTEYSQFFLELAKKFGWGVLGATAAIELANRLPEKSPMQILEKRQKEEIENLSSQIEADAKKTLEDFPDTTTEYLYNQATKKIEKLLQSQADERIQLYKQNPSNYNKFSFDVAVNIDKEAFEKRIGELKRSSWNPFASVTSFLRTGKIMGNPNEMGAYINLNSLNKVKSDIKKFDVNKDIQLQVKTIFQTLNQAFSKINNCFIISKNDCLPLLRQLVCEELDNGATQNTLINHLKNHANQNKTNCLGHVFSAKNEALPQQPNTIKTTISNFAAMTKQRPKYSTQQGNISI